MRLLLHLLILFSLALGCKSQQQVAGNSSKVAEIDETLDWRGNPDTDFYVNINLQGPLFPDGKTFYLYLQPKEGIYQQSGRNYLIIRDEVSPYPTTFTLQLPRLDKKSGSINPDPKNPTSSYSLLWRGEGYESPLYSGEIIFTMMTPEKNVVQAEFNSIVILNNQEHQLSGEFMVESFLRRR
ncbi:MAG: hypothetical protein AB8H47_11330 [Bacteroidia bacterium]